MTLLAEGKKPPLKAPSKLGALLRAKTQGDAKRRAAVKAMLLRAASEMGATP